MLRDHLLGFHESPGALGTRLDVPAGWKSTPPPGEGWYVVGTAFNGFAGVNCALFKGQWALWFGLTDPACSCSISAEPKKQKQVFWLRAATPEELALRPDLTAGAAP